MKEILPSPYALHLAPCALRPAPYALRLVPSLQIKIFSTFFVYFFIKN